MKNKKIIEEALRNYAHQVVDKKYTKVMNLVLIITGIAFLSIIVLCNIGVIGITMVNGSEVSFLGKLLSQLLMALLFATMVYVFLVFILYIYCKKTEPKEIERVLSEISEEEKKVIIKQAIQDEIGYKKQEIDDSQQEIIELESKKKQILREIEKIEKETIPELEELLKQH